MQAPRGSLHVTQDDLALALSNFEHNLEQCLAQEVALENESSGD